MEILAVRDLSFTFPGAAEPTLRGVNLELEAGDFALLTGETGSGKSTLLRLIKREIAPRGDLRGAILFQGRELGALSPREAAEKIGMVFQRPEEQIATDRVWHELAFGLENLGIPEGILRRRVAEAAQFFGLEDCFDASPEQLSGGKKQLLNLAAATAMAPELLMLDEPTARLDPIAARQFLAAVERLNRETGMTILLADHRLEDSLSRGNKLILMEKGRVLDQGTSAEVCGRMRPGSPLEGALPASVRLWRAAEQPGACPLNAGEGRAWAAEQFSPAPAASGESVPVRTKEKETPALKMREVWFRFDRKGKDILRSMNLTVREGEIFALLGGNGSGKTTLLRAAAGLIPPYSGEIQLFGKPLRDYRHGTLRERGVALLPQDSQTLFLRASVREELKDSGSRAEDLPFDLSPLLDRHPYDLSGGEQQLLGLAKTLAVKPRLLLLDEPTSGLDGAWRSRVREILRELREGGTTILFVTHDAEFASETADRCGLLFRGWLEAEEEPHAFFAGSSYYLPSVSRVLPGCITLAEAEKRLREGRP